MNNFNLLVIEDNANNIKTLEIVFEDMALCNPDFAESANEGLRKLSQNEYHLILMDLKLPDIHGYELVKIIKKRAKTRHIPVVFMTGYYLSEQDKKYGYALGAVDYILKPLDSTELRVKISQHIHSFIRIEKLLDEMKEQNHILEKQNSELKKRNRIIEHMTYHDGLTNLYNRNYMDQYILGLNLKDISPLSIVMTDMNNLKLVNDAFGHHRGDQLIVQSANYLKETFRPKDKLFRWGGDEFLIFMENTDYDTAQKIVSKAVNKNFDLGTELFKPRLAAGLSSIDSDGQTVYEAIKTAENRMYRNKLKNGKSYRSSIINSLKQTLFEKNFETEQHAERVEALVAKLANKLGLPLEQTDSISLLASLHDIGKLSVPESILLKPGRLTKDEFAIIKRHSESGYNICKTIPELLPIAENILCHHEWWNGNGYPRGISGSDIPLLARILSIADAYDVMTHMRPYKEAITSKEALEELNRCSGTQFDPYLVEVFQSIMN